MNYNRKYYEKKSITFYPMIIQHLFVELNQKLGINNILLVFVRCWAYAEACISLYTDVTCKRFLNINLAPGHRLQSALSRSVVRAALVPQQAVKRLQQQSSTIYVLQQIKHEIVVEGKHMRPVT